MLGQALATVLLTVLHTTAYAEDSDCSYKYTSQPLPFPLCDPYEGGVIRISCTVEVPCTSNISIDIGWLKDNCDQLSNDTNVTITTQPQSSAPNCRIESTLTIKNLDDSYAGRYTCNILGGEEFIPSDPLILPTHEELIQMTPVIGCAEDFVHNVDEGKCAELFINQTIPISLSCTTTDITRTSVQSNIATDSTSVSLSITHTSVLPFSSMTTILSPTPSSTLPTSTRPEEATTSAPNTPDTTAIWLYVVVAVGAVFFVIIIVLAIVCVGMCIQRSQGGTEANQKYDVHNKDMTGNGMLENSAYQGSINYPYSVSSMDALEPPPGYNGGLYEIVEPQGGAYHHLQWPTLNSGVGTKPTASPDMTIVSQTGTVSTTVTQLNSAVPPPLPSMGRRSLLPKPAIISNSGNSLDCAFQAKSLETMSPYERGRVDSTSLLLPQEKLGSSKSSPDFEGLYSQCYENAPNNPGLRHPLQNIPETGALFPEPENPNPFPTYQTISAVQPTDAPNSSDHHGSLPVFSSANQPSPLQDQKKSSLYVQQQQQKQMGNGTRKSPSREMAMSGPVYHSLEQPKTENKELTTNLPQQLPTLDSPDFTAGSESTISAFSSDFRSSNGDVSTSSTARVGNKMVSKPQHGSNNITTDFNGDSEFPNADYSTSSGSAVYPEGDWTGENSARNLAPAYNRTSTANRMAYAMPQLSHTLPPNGNRGLANLGDGAHHTIDSSKNHYKQLNPATMEPHLKYAPLNVTSTLV